MDEVFGIAAFRSRQQVMNFEGALRRAGLAHMVAVSGLHVSYLAGALTVLLASFLITALLSLASGEIIEGLPMFASILVLVLFVSLGIVFDIIGLAVATADVTAFNSMAARRLKTGKKAVWLISNTEKVSSVCNDVIGDIAGVVSGATGAAIAAQLFSESASGFWLSLTLTSLIAAVTVGGKALGKQYAVRYNEKIVYWVAKLLCGFQK